MVHRLPTTLRPHPVYQRLCGPIVAGRTRRVAQRVGPIREPLVITTDSTILDGHARWQVATDRHQPTVPCLEYDVTEDEALQIVLDRHRTSNGLNDFCRIVMALELEPFFQAPSRRSPSGTAAHRPSSNLTNPDHRDVRRAIASVAGVSTGNVTKVKQLLNAVIPDVRERLMRGEISIHRAWQWRTLTAKAQRDALWGHVNRGGIKPVITRLIRAHQAPEAPVQAPDLAAAVLSGLTNLSADDIAVVVVDLPGKAVVVTRACYDELQETHTSSPW